MDVKGGCYGKFLILRWIIFILVVVILYYYKISIILVCLFVFNYYDFGEFMIFFSKVEMSCNCS